MSPISSLAPLQTIPHPAGQVIWINVSQIMSAPVASLYIHTPYSVLLHVLFLSSLQLYPMPPPHITVLQLRCPFFFVSQTN